MSDPRTDKTNAEAERDAIAPWVQPFVAVLHAPEAPLEAVLDALGEAFSPVLRVGDARPFDCTDYYRAEMGPGLRRRLVACEALVQPGWLVPAKHTATTLEARWRQGGGRQVNLDVGYLDLGKVVLASGKGRPSKLYLAEGVWADVVLSYRGGAFHPLPWTFPDFRDGRYDADLRAMRERYRTQLRSRDDPA